MKAKLGAGLTALQGKLGGLCGKIINGRQQIGRLSIPYGISGASPSVEQLAVRNSYAQAVGLWRTATDEQIETWDLLGDAYEISGFNYLVMIMTLNQTSILPDEVEATTLDSPIVSLQGNLNRIRHWVVAISGEAWGTVSTSMLDIMAKFHASTGHKHTGGEADAPVLPYSGLSGLPDTDLSPYVKLDGSRNFTADQSMGTHKLTNVVDPTAAHHAATQNYVDAVGKAWASWTPTLTWSGPQPTGVIVEQSDWTRIGRVVFYGFSVIATDSKATTGLTVSLPVAPSSQKNMPQTGYQYNGQSTVYTDPLCVIVVSTALLAFVKFVTVPTGNSLEIRVTGFYRVS